MKLFHISDILSATTGRLVSYRHMDGIYDIYNFLTGDNLFTHAIPRAARECDPWLATQFPDLMKESPKMVPLLAELDMALAINPEREQCSSVCEKWVENVRSKFGLPVMIPVYEMGADMHTVIDPIEELEAMVGKDRMMVIPAGDSDDKND